jgi:hypothetical protein
VLSVQFMLASLVGIVPMLALGGLADLIGIPRVLQIAGISTILVMLASLAVAGPAGRPAWISRMRFGRPTDS